jgi:FMN phosphatase YigB (HAD superfamily)
MKIRAVIFDVYHTLLEVGPPPLDPAGRWEILWQDTLADPPRLSLEEFTAECGRRIERDHAAARGAGIAYPEIDWPTVAREVLPELAHLEAAQANDFLYRHAQLQRTVRLMPGAADALGALGGRGVLLGIASNAQLYTLCELDAALESAHLRRSIFDPELCFWSFAFGFSKPDPHVFRFLSARLRGRGIDPEDTLMVGDRIDNDIEPARAQHWQTWRLLPAASADPAKEGDWRQLAGKLSL